MEKVHCMLNIFVYVKNNKKKILVHNKSNEFSGSFNKNYSFLRGLKFEINTRLHAVAMG